MPIGLSYMGTKRALAPRVARLISGLPDGPLLDAFSGMCAVGEAVAPDRQVWCNDTQLFASLVGKALFASKEPPLQVDTVRALLEVSFTRNAEKLRRRFVGRLATETIHLNAGCLRAAVSESESPHVGTDSKLGRERSRLAKNPTTFPYRLASLTYAGSYFGIGQTIEIDSIQYAIDVAYRRGEITQDQRRWLVIALCRVAAKVNASTGQFAEFLRPNRRNVQRIAQKRRRNVWKEFLAATDEVKPLHTHAWRSRNRSYHSDATRRLKWLHRSSRQPSVIFADPPYSTAQYSRYYHVLDVLCEYAYPKILGMGRYPVDRFQSRFAQPARVECAMHEFVAAASECASTLVVSYPSNGLYVRRVGGIMKLLRASYPRVECVARIARLHSSFGGPTAARSVPVTENIYVATH